MAVGGVRPGALREFRKFSGSTLPGFFGAAAFDEVAVVPVAAAVDKTGRFDENFADRSVRSGFSTALALWGDPEDRAAEADRLKRLHRDVRGAGTGDFADVRYSALNPQLWNWIALSGMFLILRSFTPATGIKLSPAETEAAYRQSRSAPSPSCTTTFAPSPGSVGGPGTTWSSSAIARCCSWRGGPCPTGYCCFHWRTTDSNTRNSPGSIARLPWTPLCPTRPPAVVPHASPLPAPATSVMRDAHLVHDAIQDDAGEVAVVGNSGKAAPPQEGVEAPIG